MNTGPFHFDVSIMDVFLPLHCGSAVFLTSETPLRSQLLRTLQDARITHFYAVGTVLALMTGDGRPLDRVDLAALRTLQTGAERCNVAVVNRWLRRMPHLRFVNSYGPTEATVGCMFYAKAYAGVIEDSDCPIGTPHSNCSVIVLDRSGRAIDSPHRVGELCVGGAQLMAGYRNRPEEESRAFCTHGGRRYYRTGDLVWRDEHGRFRYHGRRDAEIKLGGRRIHPSEIERCVAALEHVTTSVCGTFCDADERVRMGLAVVLEGGWDEGLARGVLDHIAGELGPAMTPSALLVCDELPCLPSGKADVAACMQSLKSALTGSDSCVVSMPKVAHACGRTSRSDLIERQSVLERRSA